MESLVTEWGSGSAAGGTAWPWWVVPTVAVLLWAWIEIAARRRPRPGVSWELAAARLLALAALPVAWLTVTATTTQWDRSAVEAGYVAAWDALDRTAERLAQSLGDLPEDASRLELFDHLTKHLAGVDDRSTVLLFDPRGEAAAWYGPGLLHEPDIDLLPAEGRLWHRAFTTCSLWSVRSYGESGRRWRVVAGISLPQTPFPFAPGLDGAEWTMTRHPSAPEDEASESAVVLRPNPDLPGLWLHVGSLKETTGSPALHRTTGRLLLAIVMLAVIWGVRRLAPEPQSPGLGRIGPSALLPAAGAALLAAWTGAPTLLVAVTGAAAFFALFAVRWELGRDPDRGSSVSSPVPELLAAVGYGLLAAAAYGAQHHYAPFDLAGREGGEPTALILRFVLAALTTAWFLCLPRRPDVEDAVLWPAVGLAVIAAAWHDSAWGPWIGGMAAAAALGHWWASVPRRSAIRLAALALGAAFLAALLWEGTERSVLRLRLEHDYLPRMAPPTEDEINDLLISFEDYFSAWSPADEPFESVDAPSWGRDDLAFKLWQDSPLAFHDGLSAVFLQTEDGERSSFSFGLPLGEDGRAPADFSRLRIPQGKEWGRLVYGEVPIWDGELYWGELRYFFLPRPGFRFDLDELEELERNLVREKPRGDMADGLPRGAEYAFFDLNGRALASPWDTLPPLPPERLEDLDTPARLGTPDGESWSWLQVEDEGISALFLPVHSPQAGLERVGFVMLTLAPWTLALVLLLWWLPSSRAGWAAASRSALRSYSTRLNLVYTVLLLLPLIALNLILLRSFSDRLQAEKLADAQRAMVSARQFLVSYLKGLETGVLIETKVNRDLLEWMSDLVQHQVNLYWGSRIYRSSQEELFTSGLLPRRIPDQIFTRLTLRGHGMAFRSRDTGELAYLEVYAPLDVPGVLSSQQELFVSVPLLEQEEEAEQRLAELRRRALLVTSALFVLLWAAGRRLTRGFTRPIEELIEGTGRIARGEPFPEIRPRETELSALAEAIDSMSRQIDESRRGLLREKHFVERVVANITSAVVSLDRADRVVFQNQVAADLLGTEVGEPINRRLDASPMLDPVGEFWRRARAAGTPATEQVNLRPDGETVDVREWNLTFVPIPGEGDPSTLLVVDDDTEVLRGQRLEAWAEMARIIAHEIKNPLTPIQLSTEHLRQVWRVDPGRVDEVMERCTDNILSNVEELRSIASEFSIYSRIPAAQMETADLGEAMSDLSSSYRDAVGRGVEMEMQAPEHPVLARFDEKLLGRAVRNLLENAYRAAAAEGGSVRLSVRVDDAARAAEIEVADSGPGVDPQKLKRIFEPYFSTYETGTGLGLAIVQRIVHEHGGEVEARNRPSGGLSVIIRIPLAVLSSESD